MAKDSQDVKGLVQEVERGFSELRDESREFYDQIGYTKQYTDSLTAALPPQLITRIPIPSARLYRATQDTIGILRASRQFHVEAASKLKGDEKTADKLELFGAHAFGIRLDPESRLFPDTSAFMCAGPFAAWCWEWDPFRLPKDESKRESYRSSYWPFRLSVVDPLSVSFLADDASRPTLTARHFELNYVEIAKRYGEYEDFAPLVILGQQFEWLRGDRARSPESVQEAYTKKATVWEIDDGMTICHYIEIGGEYHAVTKEVPNPWGRPHIQIIPGRFNPWAERLADRYTGIMKDLGREQRNADTLWTQAVSIALTPDLWVEKMPENMGLEGNMNAVEPTQLIEGKNGPVATPVRGDVQSVGQKLMAPVMEMLSGRLAERDALLPSPYLTSPDDNLLKNATTTAMLAAQETSSKAYDDPREAVLNAIRTGYKMMIHFIAEGQVKGNPQAKDEGVAFLVTGKEVTKKYRGDEKGRDILIKPEDVQDFDEKYTLEISVVPSSVSQKKAHYDITRQEVADGVNTLKGLIEVTTEDVEGRVFELHEETRYQALLPTAMKLDLMAFVEFMRLSEGRDMSQLMLSAGIGPDMGQQAGQLQGETDSGMTVNPPPQSVPSVEVAG